MAYVAPEPDAAASAHARLAGTLDFYAFASPQLLDHAESERLRAELIAAGIAPDAPADFDLPLVATIRAHRHWADVFCAAVLTGGGVWIIARVLLAWAEGRL